MFGEKPSMWRMSSSSGAFSGTTMRRAKYAASPDDATEITAPTPAPTPTAASSRRVGNCESRTM
ncbi:Uncharacterised protein [Mycobacteroides abscessus subsp. abscessus]|nr:Uncharacterised protein [Mycobacteroides abscessus subsp. abscessus]